MVAVLEFRDQRACVAPLLNPARCTPHPPSQVLAHKGEHVAAVREFRDKHARPLVDALKAPEGGWVVPVVMGMAVTLKQLSERGDEDALRKGGHGNNVSGGRCVWGAWEQREWGEVCGGHGNNMSGGRCGGGMGTT